jgi:hypothetical protein
MVIHCDNTSAINISKNPVQHSRTKHIDIWHHFICDLVESRKVALLCLFPQKINWLISSPNLLMEAGLNLLEKPVVFVTCPRHVFDSCSDKTLLFLLVSSVGCMNFFYKKKLGEFGARVMLQHLSVISCIFICFNSSLCFDKIYIHMVKFLNLICAEFSCCIFTR